MNNIALRLYILLCTVMMWLQTFAQNDDDDDDFGFSGGGRLDPDDMSNMEDLIDQNVFRLTFSDILTIILVLVACYIFGKIWKGCTYLILVLAAIFYYMLR
ncbi:MAG: hypothetical protein IJV34_04575 [Prevotella sp.]|nr:hypothetical protein [Prevotella sp.]